MALSVLGGLLIWNATSVSGHLPRTFLGALYRKSAVHFWVIAIGTVLGVGLLIAGAFFDSYWVRIVSAVVLAAGGTEIFAIGGELGRHATVVNSSDVLQRAVMSSFEPGAIEPLAKLAQSFATCSRWFSPVPGETWPNRNFVHAGTSDGAVDIEYRLYNDDTIFQRLEDNHGAAEDPWRVYFKGVPQVLAYPALWEHLGPEGATAGRFRTLDRLIEDIDNSDLPAYSFVEPFHGTTIEGSMFEAPLGTTCSQHAGNNRIPVDQYDGSGNEAAGRDFLAGMDLVAEIYQHLKERPELFAKTVFVLTYDEHGGFFDHWRPPTDAVAPQGPGVCKRVSNWLLTWLFGARAKSFDFKMLGPRVPTIIISPCVVAAPVDDTFDHTSIPRTVRVLFGITEKLSDREDAANTFDRVITHTVRPKDDLPDLGDWLLARAESTRAPQPAPPADDGFRRSLDWLGLTRANYLDLRERQRGTRAVPKARTLRKAQRTARRESLKALGRAEAGDSKEVDKMRAKVAAAVTALEADADRPDSLG